MAGREAWAERAATPFRGLMELPASPDKTVAPAEPVEKVGTAEPEGVAAPQEFKAARAPTAWKPPTTRWIRSWATWARPAAPEPRAWEARPVMAAPVEMGEQGAKGEPV